MCHRSFEDIVTKRAERPTVLLEYIDNAIRDVVFECFVLSCYESTMSPSKSPTYWFFHADVTDVVGITTITIIAKGNLVKTHVDKLKRGIFLRLEKFSVRGRSDYDKENSDWTIDISTATKAYEIPPFDPLIKLFFHVSDTIRSFERQMLQPFATSTLVGTVIGVRGKVNQKFELLVANGHDAEDIQVVSIPSTLF